MDPELKGSDQGDSETISFIKARQSSHEPNPARHSISERTSTKERQKAVGIPAVLSQILQIILCKSTKVGHSQHLEAVFSYSSPIRDLSKVGSITRCQPRTHLFILTSNNHQAALLLTR